MVRAGEGCSTAGAAACGGAGGDVTGGRGAGAQGIKGRDFVMVCSDTCAAQQIITIKHDEDKLVPIDAYKLMALAGALLGTHRLVAGRSWHGRSSPCWASCRRFFREQGFIARLLPLAQL